jgi:hypothetical protein
MENTELKKGKKVSASFFVSDNPRNYKGEIYFNGEIIRCYRNSFDLKIESIESYTNSMSDESINEMFGGIGGIIPCYKYKKSHNGTKYQIILKRYE